MALPIIDAQNLEALKETLGVKALEKRVKDLEDSSAAAASATPAASDSSDSSGT